MRDEAEAACARLTLGQQQPSGALRTVHDLVDGWLAAQEEAADLGQISRFTLVSRTTCVRALDRHLGPVLLEAVTVTTLERYRDARLRPAEEPPRPRKPGQRGVMPRRGGMAPRTVRLELEVLVEAWTWAMERHGLHGPPPRVRVRLRDVRDQHTPSREDAIAILAHLDGWPWLAARLLWATGCRPGEIATLRRCDVDTVQALLRVRGKTGYREVAVVAQVLADLLPHLPESPDALVLGVSPSTVRTHLGGYLRRACEAAGVRPWTAYGYRRHATDSLYETGADPGTERSQLGHSAEVALRRYRTVRLDARRLAVQAAGLGVLPEQGDGTVVLLGVAGRQALERALIDAATRGDMAEVQRIAARLSGTRTAQSAG